MLTAKVKKVMKMHICISRPERAKRFWIVFLTLMVHKLRIELPKNIFVPSLIINGLLERKKMRILSCSNLNYLSLCKILYILLLSTLSYFSSRSWVWMRRREKTNGVELCPDCAYSLGWIILFKIKYFVCYLARVLNIVIVNSQENVEMKSVMSVWVTSGMLLQLLTCIFKTIQSADKTPKYFLALTKIRVDIWN